VKIAVLTLDFPPEIGGVQTYLYETMRRLGRAHQVTVVTPVAGELPADVPLRKVIVAEGKALRFWQALRAIRPDLVIVGHAHPQLLLPAALYERYETFTPFATVTYGNDYLAAQQRWHRRLFNRLLSRSRPLITITQANAIRLQNLGLPWPHIIYPGADPTRFTPPSGIRETDLTAWPPILLTAGRLVARKGIDTVLYALPALLASFPEIKYHVAGDGPDGPRLQAITQELGLENVVTFLGQVNDAQLLAAYQRAHLFVMPAREEVQSASLEGFGIVYLEASACALPVIAGRSGGAVEAVRDGETGYLVEPQNPEALAKIVCALLQNAELRRQIGQNGRRWVETAMNWDRAGQEFAGALQ
jgi:phosphatidylinositol alpha-1,6-mannosyltransferase